MSFELMIFSIFANELIHRFMYRKAEIALADWKNRKLLKPLILTGARQVGKTWLMKNFGQHTYRHVVYINFDNNQQMQDLFEANMKIERIITGLELYSGNKIDPKNTLLIFDEIQEVPKALTS